MAQSDKDNSNKPKWQQHLKTVFEIAGGVASIIMAVNGVDTYIHNHPNGLNNHDWKG
jgi:hypothetical protein